MDIVSHRVDLNQVKPGDHIYTWRTAFTYSHHGIYVGENKVIHFTAPQTATSGSGWNLCSSIPSSSLNSIDCELSHPKSGQNYDYGSLCTCECGSQQSESGVIASCLSCFIGTGSLYLYRYGVNTWECVTKLRGGTCTTAQSDPPEDVINRAEYLLQDQHGFGDYNVVRNNCEDFALYCKTGLLVTGNPTTGGSGQVNFFFNAPWKTILSSALPEVLCRTSGLVTVVVVVGKHCYDKYRTDIGVRDDTVKVKVEDVALYRPRSVPVQEHVEELESHDGNVTEVSCT